MFITCKPKNWNHNIKFILLYEIYPEAIVILTFEMSYSK